MVCGSKRYDALVKVEGEPFAVTVSARSPAEARKAIRREYGQRAEILRVGVRKGPGQIRLS